MKNMEKKNFYYPTWLEPIMEAESERCGGKGAFVATAVYLYSRLSDKEKMNAYLEFRRREAEIVFADKSAQDAAESAARDVPEPRYKPQKHKGRLRSG